jgi:hypothetical protein
MEECGVRRGWCIAKTNEVCKRVRRRRRLERRHPAPLRCVRAELVLRRRVRDDVHVLRALVLQVVDVCVAAVRQGRTSVGGGRPFAGDRGAAAGFGWGGG